MLVESSHFEDIYIAEDDSPPAPSTTSGTTDNIHVVNCRIERDVPLPSYAETNEAIRFNLVHRGRTFVFENCHFEGYQTSQGGSVAGIIYIESGAYPIVRLVDFTVCGVDNLVVLKRPESGFQGIIFSEIGAGNHRVHDTYFEVWSGETDITYKTIPMTDWYKYFLDKRVVKLSGDGSTTEFSIEHTLWTRDGRPPVNVIVVPLSADAAQSPFAVICGSRTIKLKYQSAPPAGTDNLVYLIVVKRDVTLEKGL